MNRIDWHGLCGSRRKPFAEMLFSRLLGTLRVSRRVFRPLQCVCSEEIQSDHIVRNISFIRAPGIVLGLGGESSVPAGPVAGGGQLRERTRFIGVDVLARMRISGRVSRRNRGGGRGRRMES